MTFLKSNLNMLSESLFTELTADQAQMLEGGKRIDILSVRCIKASGGSDRLSFTIDGQDVMFGRTIDIQTGGVANVGVGANFNVPTPQINVYDRGSFIGGFVIAGNAQKTREVHLYGSIYEVTYKATGF
jgi:hypothetical protein